MITIFNLTNLIMCAKDFTSSVILPKASAQLGYFVSLYYLQGSNQEEVT